MTFIYYNYNAKRMSNRVCAQVPVFGYQQDYALSAPKSLVFLFVEGLVKKGY